jgi:hypothetical protein
MNLRNELVKQFAEQVAGAHDRMALDMILHGMFPSQGWCIGYTMELDERQMKHTCFPVPPRT